MKNTSFQGLVDLALVLWGHIFHRLQYVESGMEWAWVPTPPQSDQTQTVLINMEELGKARTLQQALAADSRNN